MKYEVTFLPVGEGSGDAIVMRYGNDHSGYTLHVVDGGRTDTADTIISHITKHYNDSIINHMVLTHADDDHATGLVGVMKKIKVEHLWMNRPWLYVDEIQHHFHGGFTTQGLIDEIKKRHPYLVELEKLAIENGTQIHEVFQGDMIGAFTVLAPLKARYIRSIPDFGKTPDRYTKDEPSKSFGLEALFAKTKQMLEENWDIETLAAKTETSASNESCVVQYAALGHSVALLTADVGPVGLNEAADYSDQLNLLKPTFVQVPHHGSRHNITPSVLDRWLGPKVAADTKKGVAFCSVGSNKEDYPRGQVINAFMRRGFKVYSTRTKWISHSLGGGLPNTRPAVAEEFRTKVEGL